MDMDNSSKAASRAVWASVRVCCSCVMDVSLPDKASRLVDDRIVHATTENTWESAGRRAALAEFPRKATMFLPCFFFQRELQISEAKEAKFAVSFFVSILFEWKMVVA